MEATNCALHSQYNEITKRMILYKSWVFSTQRNQNETSHCIQTVEDYSNFWTADRNARQPKSVCVHRTKEI